MRTTPLPRLLTAATLALALAACGSSSGTKSGGTSGSSGPTQSSTAAGAAPAAPAASAATADPASAATAAPAAPSEPGPICDSIPGLDVISTIVGEPLTAIDDHSQPAVEIEGTLHIAQRCEATGAAIGTAIFERSDLSSGAALLAEIESQGLIHDGSWPGLPGAVAWANGLTIEHEGLYYTATAITPDTVGQLDAPAAYDASAALLAAWIGR